MLEIPTITLWQPWATLIALGEKQIETRSWPINKKFWGPLAIHASAKPNEMTKWALSQEPFARILRAAGYESIADMPFGSVLAICILDDCVRITPGFTAGLTDKERAFGDYNPGRFAWRLKDNKRLEHPILAKGKQGIWLWQMPEGVKIGA